MTEIKSLAGAGLETAQNDDRNKNLRKGLKIAGGVALAGISLFAAVKYKNKVNAVKAEQIREKIKEYERLITPNPPSVTCASRSLYEILAEKCSNIIFSTRIAELQKQLKKLERINRIF